MSAPLFVQYYLTSGLPYIRQIWRASRLKFVFDRSQVDQALLWVSENSQWSQLSEAIYIKTETENENDANGVDNPTMSSSHSTPSGEDFVRWLAKRASALGLARALEKSAQTNNGVVLRCIVPHLDSNMDLSDLVSLSAHSEKWEAVTVLSAFARPTPHNTALLAAVQFGQVGLIPTLVTTSCTSVINKSLNNAAKTKQPAAVALLINHCAEWARTDALGQALMNNCVDSVHLLAPLSDCWLVKDWAQRSLRLGWEEGSAAMVLNQYMPQRTQSTQKM